MSADRPLVFLSYASPDRARVASYFEWLSRRGLNVWFDSKRLLPGQQWDLEINRAIDRAMLIIVFVSTESVGRRGYVQRELKRALDRQRDHLADDIFLIPVLLDDVPIPSELKGIQAVYASDPDCKRKLEAAVQFQLQRLGHALQQAQAESGISWESFTVKEEWNGLPGYSFAVDLLEFSSIQYRDIGEITDYIRGVMKDRASAQRMCKLDQMPDFFESRGDCASFEDQHL